MTSQLLTEAGEVLMAETLEGIPEASSLNDIDVQPINKETFSTDPTSRGWMLGSRWSWDSVNLRLKIT